MQLQRIDGVILVIAKDDHKLRIEVGRGLEGPIPDVVAKRVIRKVTAPLASHFPASGANSNELPDKPVVL